MPSVNELGQVLPADVSPKNKHLNPQLCYLSYSSDFHIPKVHKWADPHMQGYKGTIAMLTSYTYWATLNLALQIYI